MRAIVLHVNTASRESVSPTMRIARFVADELRLPLVHNVETAKRELMPALGKLDVLFLKLGVLKFSQHREEAVELVRRARLVINLENDCTFKPDKRLNREDMRKWSTVEYSLGLKGDQYINWNKLTWSDWHAKSEQLQIPEHMRVLYYGAYKDIRESSFSRYFGTTKFPLTISSFRGGPKFKVITKNTAEIIGAFKDKTMPQRYALTIYMEDDYSHAQYSSPANRFYECLQLGVAQVFDNKSVWTLERAGYRVPGNAIVTGPNDVAQALKNWRHLQHWQRQHWYRDYGKELRHELRKVCCATFGAQYTFN